MPQLTGTLLIPCDIGAQWGRPQIDALAHNLESRLKQPVVYPGSRNYSADSVSATVQSLADTGIDRIVALPLGLLSTTDRGDFVQSLAWVSQKSSSLRLHLAAPLSWVELIGWLRATAVEALSALAMRPEAVAVLLVGESGASEANADLARVAQFLLEASPLARVQYAFLERTRPGVSDVLNDLARVGLRQIVVLPWLFEDESRFEQLRAEVVDAAHTFGLSASLALPSLSHAVLINLLISKHSAALSEEPISVPSGSEGRASPSDNAPEISPPAPTITPTDLIGLQALRHRINALLPPEYQGRYETVPPRSMGTATLKFDGDGKVAWGEIWTSFCDLALAGGPPHRGRLLEAVTTQEVLADPEAYQKVLEEIERGIRLVTGLPIVASRSPGWVGVRCESEEMAVWLMRAIIVENVMVRREGDTIYLPAGPRFKIEREIKNVITTVAKTVHYWVAHLTARQKSQ